MLRELTQVANSGWLRAGYGGFLGILHGYAESTEHPSARYFDGL